MMPERIKREAQRGKVNVIIVARKVIGQGIVGKKEAERKAKALSKRGRARKRES